MISEANEVVMGARTTYYGLNNLLVYPNESILIHNRHRSNVLNSRVVDGSENWENLTLSSLGSVVTLIFQIINPETFQRSSRVIRVITYPFPSPCLTG
jgi:hypothetical protein